jgi:LPS export ABC transporter protein LptC
MAWLAFMLSQCTESKIKVADVSAYTGPLVVLTGVDTYFSDSAILVVRLAAPVQEEYDKGDRIFPKGLEVYFFKKDRTLSATLTARYGKFDKAKKLYTVTGNVVVRNVEEGKVLQTEELNWNPETKKVFTDKFVVIETPQEVLKGQGLEATQDFTSYRILKPTGVFSVNDL